jgi:hypothetical protein
MLKNISMANVKDKLFAEVTKIQGVLNGYKDLFDNVGENDSDLYNKILELLDRINKADDNQFINDVRLAKIKQVETIKLQRKK